MSENNEADFLAQELGDGDLAKSRPQVAIGEYKATSSEPSVRLGRSEKGPWARLRITFLIDDEDERARLAPNIPTARYEEWLDVVDDPSTSSGIRLAKVADREGANHKLRTLAKNLGIAGGSISNIRELADRTAYVYVAEEADRHDPDVKYAVVKRVRAYDGA